MIKLNSRIFSETIGGVMSLNSSIISKSLLIFYNVAQFRKYSQNTGRNFFVHQGSKQFRDLNLYFIPSSVQITTKMIYYISTQGFVTFDGVILPC